MQPEMTINEFGNTIWLLDGGFHRTDGPAIEYTSGDKEWWVNNKIHRIDGPAVELADGSARWWLNSVELTFDDWLDNNLELTDEEKVMMKLKYG
jgi:hypothetical protein